MEIVMLFVEDELYIIIDLLIIFLKWGGLF